jgi:hypothetical protein
MLIPITRNYESEFDLYYALIAINNVAYQWGLTETQMKILVYLIRFGYSKKTKDIICEKLDITEKSLTTNLSYMRQGRVGKKKIKKLLKTSPNNTNVTLLNVELKDIKEMVESNDNTRSVIIDFGDETLPDKLKREGKVIEDYVKSLKKEIANLKKIIADDTSKKITTSN